MNIKTSYFANWRKFPKDYVPISIATYSPKGFKGLIYDKVAPGWDIMKLVKEQHDEQAYIRVYNDKLQTLDREQVFKDLEELSGGKDILLLCYEKPSDLCHRHLLAAWLDSTIEEL